MEMSQGNSLCSYLKRTKMSFTSFFFTKLENRRAEQILSGRSWYQWERERCGERR
jgi:hypothetical protein